MAQRLVNVLGFMKCLFLKQLLKVLFNWLSFFEIILTKDGCTRVASKVSGLNGKFGYKLNSFQQLKDNSFACLLMQMTSFKRRLIKKFIRRYLLW